MIFILSPLKFQDGRPCGEQSQRLTRYTLRNVRNVCTTEIRAQKFSVRC